MKKIHPIITDAKTDTQDTSRSEKVKSKFPGDISKWDTSNVTDMSPLFADSKIIDLNSKTWSMPSLEELDKIGEERRKILEERSKIPKFTGNTKGLVMPPLKVKSEEPIVNSEANSVNKLFLIRTKATPTTNIDKNNTRKKT